MKLRGFTLAELLIVLGITGIVAAVILPAINGLMPDKTKINYLKVYDELNNSIKALTADSTIFPVILKNGGQDIDVSKIPLLNDTKPLKSPFKDDSKYSGDKKLCNLLAFSMGVNESCKDTSYPSTPSFTTPNGMEWWISQTKREITENKASYQTDIYVDVDSSKDSSNCMFGESNCQNPDRFKFLLAADGTLVPADPVGLHYINTRKNFLKKKFNVEGDVLASLADNLLDNDTDIIGDDGVGGGDDDDGVGGGDDDDDNGGDNGGEEPNPVNAQPEIVWTPSSFFIDVYKNLTNFTTNNRLARVPIGLSISARTKNNATYTFPVKISLDLTMDGKIKTYSCTIPAGSTSCNTNIINPYHLIALWEGRAKVGTPYTDVESILKPSYSINGVCKFDTEQLFYSFVKSEMSISQNTNISNINKCIYLQQFSGLKIYPKGDGPNSSYYEIQNKGYDEWYYDGRGISYVTSNGTHVYIAY